MNVYDDYSVIPVLPKPWGGYNATENARSPNNTTPFSFLLTFACIYFCITGLLRRLTVPVLCKSTYLSSSVGLVVQAIGFLSLILLL